MKHDRIRCFLRLGVAGVFISAAILKIAGPSGSATMYGAQTAVMRTAIVTIELFLAIWLIVGVRVRIAALLAATILSLFTGMIALEITKERPKPCGCFAATAVGTTGTPCWP